MVILIYAIIVGLAIAFIFYIMDYLSGSRFEVLPPKQNSGEIVSRQTGNKLPPRKHIAVKQKELTENYSRLWEKVITCLQDKFWEFRDKPNAPELAVVIIAIIMFIFPPQNYIAENMSFFAGWGALWNVGINEYNYPLPTEVSFSFLISQWFLLVVVYVLVKTLKR